MVLLLLVRLLVLVRLLILRRLILILLPLGCSCVILLLLVRMRLLVLLLILLRLILILLLYNDVPCRAYAKNEQCSPQSPAHPSASMITIIPQ